MKRLWILLLCWSLVACGIPESASQTGNSGVVSDNEPLGGADSTPIDMIGGPLDPNAPTPAPLPTINPFPVVMGNTIQLNIGRHWSTTTETITLTLTQQLLLLQQGTRAYTVAFDDSVIALDPQSNREHPNGNGWLWHPQAVGTSTITISERETPCTQEPCPGGAPPRTVHIPIQVVP